MKTLPSLKNNNGFTLIEAVISIFVVSIGLMAITRMQIASIQGNAFAMNTLQATVESTANSEWIMSNSFNNVLGGTTVPVTSADGRYQTNCTYQNITLFNNEIYQVITITTTWNEKGRNKTLQTTITKLPGEGA